MPANGKLDVSTLTPVPLSAGGYGYLEKSTAQGWFAAREELIHVTGTIPIIINDGLYRDYARQVYWKTYWTRLGKPENAATPGTSNHGFGLAVDINNISAYNQSVLDSVMANHGFVRDTTETWHYHHTSTNPADSGSSEIVEEVKKEEYKMLVYANQSTNVWVCADQDGVIAIPSGQGDAYVKISGHDLISLTATEFNIMLGRVNARRQFDTKVIANTDTNAWAVMGPNIDFAIPAGDSALWENLYGPHLSLPNASVLKIRSAFAPGTPSSFTAADRAMLDDIANKAELGSALTNTVNLVNSHADANKAQIIQEIDTHGGSSLSAFTATITPVE